MPHELYGQLRAGVNAASHRELARSSLIHLCGPRMKIKLHAPDSAKKQHRHGEQVLGSKVSRWLAQACLCHRLMMAPLWWRRRRALRLNHTRTALYYTYSAAAREGAAVCAAWKKCRVATPRTLVSTRTHTGNVCVLGIYCAYSGSPSLSGLSYYLGQSAAAAVRICGEVIANA